MRLLSVTLRHYRIHRELQVEFDPSRTVIGGENESGKSTLVEAIHRALFLKAKGNTEQHRALRSAQHTGHPEVELRFESGGRTYLLRKRFGPSGTVSLSAEHEAALNGEAAEEELARLLRVEAGLAGKAVAAQWAHLWVWQGQAGNDPTELASTQQESLVRRLQEIGGAGALQSELDHRLAQRFAQERERLFTQTGKPRAGTPLETANDEHREAAEGIRQARERIRLQEETAAALETATLAKDQAASALRECEANLQHTRQQRKELDLLRQREAKEQRDMEDTGARLTALRRAQADFDTLTRRLAEDGADRDRLQHAVEERNVRHQLLSREAQRTEAALLQTAETLRTARSRKDLAAEWRQLWDLRAACAALTARAAEAAQLRGRIQDLREQLLALPAIDEAACRNLRDLEGTAARRRAALEAMAAGLEVLAATQPVTASGAILHTGDHRVFTEDTEVSVGDTVLRIIPGGGSNLTRARQEKADAEETLANTLRACGVASVQEATSIAQNRAGLQQQIQTLETRLDALDAGSLDQTLEKTELKRQATEATVHRLQAQLPGESAPADGDAAAALYEGASLALEQVERAEQEARTERDASLERLRESETQREETLLQLHAKEREQQGLKGQLKQLQDTHGDVAALGQALAEAETSLQQAQTKLQHTRNTIEGLQPELLESQTGRWERALEQKRKEEGDWRVKIAECRQSLRSDGGADPWETLNTAEARLRSVAARRDDARRHAEAIALLDDLFREEEASLEERFTGPLVEKVAGYLSRLFGPGAAARLQLDGHRFAGLRLSRPASGNEAFSFEALSGGAREQVAAAVRLAMAEVLAPDFDGALPVVLDDAFAYSDPDRVQRLQDMLDLAASRGLQIIVLTCNPADYRGLGARTHLLPRPAPVCGPELPATDGPEPAETADSNLRANPLAAGHVAVTPDLQQCFLEALQRLGGSSGNIALREALGWDSRLYDAVKASLVQSSAVVTGRGRGGSVSLAELPST